MLAGYLEKLPAVDPYKHYGKIHRVVGLLIESAGPVSSVGDICYIYPSSSSGERFLAEVVGFDNEKVLLMPFAPIKDVGPGCLVEAVQAPLAVKVGHGLIGNIIDPLGNRLDGGKLPKGLKPFATDRNPPNPMTRPRILKPIETGVRVIDTLLTVGEGQRVGIFAGSGVGKSTLLGMIARKSSADINVIALIGERGREVREFIETDLGPEGLAKSVIVVATSDQPALMRIKGAYTATAISEYFRDQGMHVNLMMDSVTRVAMAQREIGLASGEPPTTKGYTPSVFAALPKLLERTGTNNYGAITAFYTVLVDGDDMNEPISDTVRGILDGHFVLDRKLAEQGQFPAINVLRSISRVMPQIVNDEAIRAAQQFRTKLALYEENKELIQIGAYKRGTNPDLDQAVQYQKSMINFLKQGMHEFSPRTEAVSQLQTLFEKEAL